MRYPKEIQYVKSYLKSRFRYDSFDLSNSYRSFTSIYELDIIEQQQYDVVDCNLYYRLIYIIKDHHLAKQTTVKITTRYDYTNLDEMLDLFNKINKLWECVKTAKSPSLQEKEFNKMFKIINIDFDFC